mmetsp:Transcript_14043/g.34772  ORF Transcript_14043/g.34772 Transcript_14043/m.34772 type:complete len:431 (-) Transcript_14043:136-1428(-)|eukprot:CAMPEP_0178998650 /NCGR_PEP_ID=MMETSP0795-20121207/9625_1 /TAXON_ID=88552 /ORGANISM="Amoebophrya sp., Strain Ameob2" /LENGTH=430 /DNA_ID=CAMNT_0020691341 /DNA_START=399 /DNA_END=1691 /DNA_ORIENTATION=-
MSHFPAACPSGTATAATPGSRPASASSCPTSVALELPVALLPQRGFERRRLVVVAVFVVVLVQVTLELPELLLLLPHVAENDAGNATAHPEQRDHDEAATKAHTNILEADVQLDQIRLGWVHLHTPVQLHVQVPVLPHSVHVGVYAVAHDAPQEVHGGSAESSGHVARDPDHVSQLRVSRHGRLSRGQQRVRPRLVHAWVVLLYLLPENRGEPRAAAGGARAVLVAVLLLQNRGDVGQKLQVLRPHHALWVLAVPHACQMSVHAHRALVQVLVVPAPARATGLAPVHDHHAVVPAGRGRAQLVHVHLAAVVGGGVLVDKTPRVRADGVRCAHAAAGGRVGHVQGGALRIPVNAVPAVPEAEESSLHRRHAVKHGQKLQDRHKRGTKHARVQHPIAGDARKGKLLGNLIDGKTTQMKSLQLQFQYQFLFIL